MLLWEELVEVSKQYLANPSDQELEEYFAAACLAKVRIIVQAYVRQKGFGDIFVDEGISLSHEKLTQWMRGECQLNNPEALKGLIGKLAKNATVDVVREWFGREDSRRAYGPIETVIEMKGKKEIVQLFDQPKEREAAFRCPQYQSSYYHDPKDIFEKSEEKEVLAKLIDMYAEQGTKRDRDCALWIKVRIEDELPVGEIAKRRGTTPDDVWHLFQHDADGMLRLYRRHFAERM